MIANDRFDNITVKEVGGRWTVCDADDVTLYEYTTETAATYKAEQVRDWGRRRVMTGWRRPNDGKVVADTGDLCSGAADDQPENTLGTAIDPVAAERGTQSGTARCGVLAPMDERISLMSLVVRSHRHLADKLGRELQEAVDIPPAFFDVLTHVASAPGGRLAMGRLSAEVALTTGGATRLVDRVVEAGLVVRESSPSDRRSVHVVLTQAGQEMFERAVAAHLESIDRHLITPLDDDDRAALTGALIKLLGSDCGT